MRKSQRHLTCLGFYLALFIASTPVYSQSQLGWGVGVGFQYGGIVGAQGTVGTDETKLKLAVGVVGLSGGIEQFVSENLSVGYQAYGIVFSHGWGLYINYHYPNGQSDSWVIGLDYIHRSKSEFFSSTTKEHFFSVSIGYTFK